MKKILALTVLGGLLGAASLQAQTADIYMTGSTAFRASAYNAIKLLYSTLTSENAGSLAVSSSNSRWTMSGQMSSLFGARTIIIHANFNGSVQGVHGLYDNTDKSVFLKNATASDMTLVTNSVTCAFTDVDSSATAYALNPASFIERYVAVQPFCYVRSLNAPTSITNVTIQQLQTVMPNGQLPLSYLTGNTNDVTNNITLVNRSLDSGTRVTAYADAFVAGSPQVYYWLTNSGVAGFYLATFNLGPALYGYGYVGGGDVKNVLIINDAKNISFGYVGLSDSKNVNSGLNTLSYNGFFPSSDIKTGSAIPTAPVFDSVRNGQYSYWAYEVFAQPKTVTAADQNITGTDLTSFCRSLAGYNASETFVGGVGSIDNDIATNPTKIAVRLGDMNVSRSSVGGAIAP